VQVVVRQLAHCVDPSDVQFHVVTARPAIPEDRLGDLPVTVSNLDHDREGYRLRDRIRIMVAAARAVRRYRSDVVHLHSGSAWMGALVPLVAPRAGIVLEVHDAPGSGRHDGWTDRLESLWSRVGGAVLVCHSSSVAADLRQRWRTSDDRVRVVPLAVDTVRFHPRDPSERAAWRRRHGLGDTGAIVVVAGRLVASKRVESVLDTIALLRSDGVDVHGLVVGRGPSESAVRHRAAEPDLAGAVVVTGGLDDGEFAAAIGAADLLCSASVYEGFGLAIAEAMASGVPVVATSVGGVTDVVDDRVTGVLVPTDRPDLFDRAVRELIEDGQLRRGMGAAARLRAVEVFGSEAFGAAFVEVYRRSAARAATLSPARSEGR
jgi:glycosyltransferase involved in cell wall biosynthesis